MVSIGNALDNLSNLSVGENGSLQHSWSPQLNEKIYQLYFQLVRTKDYGSIRTKFKEILNEIYLMNNTNYEYYLNTITKLILFTRDIIGGKGEYELTYELISLLYNSSINSNISKERVNNIQNLVVFIIESLVYPLDGNPKTHPMGSWKDLKYLLHHHTAKSDYKYRNFEFVKSNIIAKTIINLYVSQLKKDKDSNNPSLMARWLPRENSKFGWMTSFIATNNYPMIMNTAKSEEQMKKARVKCLTLLRKEVAAINSKINTVQVMQCSGNWSKINFEKDVTSITLAKQKKAFMGTGKSTPNAFIVSPDRMTCARNFEKFTHNVKHGTATAKGKRVSIYDFVKDAINYNDYREKELIDAQWDNNRSQNKNLKNVIAMCDTSGSMECDNCLPLYNAIGLAIRVSELSIIKDRIMTFSSSPSWIDLSNIQGFVYKVQKVKNSPWGMNTNFDAALKMILDSAIANNIHPNEFRDVTLLVLSDMQIDHAGKHDVAMFNRIQQMFTNAGMQRWGIGYEMPHIVFWNLRKTDGFPNLSTDKNVTGISGYSPVLINKLTELGIDVLRKMTGFEIMTHSLNNERYKFVNDKISKIIRANETSSHSIKNRTIQMDLD